MREGKSTMLRLRRFRTIQNDKVELLGRMMLEFRKMAAELADQVTAEEERTGNKDAKHFAYSTLAKAAALRRHNLMTSVTDIQSRLDVAKRELREATLQLHEIESAQKSSIGSTHNLGVVEKHFT
jgi:hypothetical protein